MTLKSNNTFRSIAISLLSFVLLVFAAYRYSNYKKGLWEKDVRNNLLELLIAKKSALEKALYSRIYYTKGVASFVSLKPDITDEEFNILAYDLVGKDTLIISSMALSKNCVIGSIYPYIGHEEAIGLDLMQHPERKEIVDKSIKTRKTFVAGPLELVEGGIAFVSYTPIFNKTNKNNNEFWGVTDIVILMNPLLEEAGILQEENEIDFSLRGYNGAGNNGDIFYGKKDIFKQNPVSVSINLPNGNWILAAVPGVGWSAFYSQDNFIKVYLMISSFIISLLIGLVFYNISKTKRSEKKLKAIFKSLDSLIFEFNKNGIYKNVATTKLSLLIKPPNELIGKSVNDIFNEENAQQIMDAIHRCIQSRDLVIIEYPILLNNTTNWFQGRISFKSNDSVIFNAIDITEHKRNAERLEKSELKLRKSNFMKDKLFAVLSHDLRNSLGSFIPVIEILANDYNLFTEEDKKTKLGVIHNSSLEVNTLLESILEWQIIQSRSADIELERNSIKQVCDRAIEQQKLTADKKQIQILNSIPENVFAFYNDNLCATIFRNILSNAIKFSHVDSTIKIYQTIKEVADKKYLAISIEDNGIGIRKEKIEEFYSSSLIPTSLGTLSEKGNGLGIFLCKEFVELQGGELLVESELNKGSTFTFTLNI